MQIGNERPELHGSLIGRIRGRDIAERLTPGTEVHEPQPGIVVSGLGPLLTELLPAAATA